MPPPRSPHGDRFCSGDTLVGCDTRSTRVGRSHEERHRAVKIALYEGGRACRDDAELAYVLHLKSLALSRMGHFDTALRLPALPRRVQGYYRNEHLLVRVLLSIAPLCTTSQDGTTSGARVYTEKVMAV